MEQVLASSKQMDMETRLQGRGFRFLSRLASSRKGLLILSRRIISRCFHRSVRSSNIKLTLIIQTQLLPRLDQTDKVSCTSYNSNNRVVTLKLVKVQPRIVSFRLFRVTFTSIKDRLEARNSQWTHRQHLRLGHKVKIIHSLSLPIQ